MAGLEQRTQHGVTAPMMLRWLVSNWLRQAAQEHLQQAVGEAFQRGSGQAEEDVEETPLPPVDIAVVFALGVESGGLLDLLSNRITTRYASHIEHRGELAGHQLVVAESGVGQDAARSTTEHLIQLHQPRWFVSAGFAAALDENLRRGHVLMSDEVINSSDDRLTIGLTVDRASAESSPSLHIGRLLTTDSLVRNRDEKEALATAHDALACDMETFAIAEACQAGGTKLLSVRIITDCFNDQLAPEIERLLNQNSVAGKLGAAAGALFNRPSTVKDMWKLKEDALKATDRLGRFLSSMIQQLP